MYVCRWPPIDHTPWANVTLGLAIGFVIWGCIAAIAIASIRHRITRTRTPYATGGTITPTRLTSLGALPADHMRPVDLSNITVSMSGVLDQERLIERINEAMRRRRGEGQ